jgi:hypothetical protein
MKTTLWFIFIFFFIALIIVSHSISSAQTVIQIDWKQTPLTHRWKIAKADANHRDFNKGYWIGYSIQRLMEERSFIGSYYSDRSRNHPTLEELLTGMKKEGESPNFSLGNNTTIKGSMSFNESEKAKRKVKKEVAILFHMVNNVADNITDLEVSNLSLHVDLENDPLIWIGSVNQLESVPFLEIIYKKATTDEVKKHLMMALGLHDETKEAIEVLKAILQSSEHSDVREDAAFWLGQTNTEEARKILIETAWNDKSDDVREKAVFSISEMGGEASIDALIVLAKTHHNAETRKKAAFWLGQKASEKTIGALKELAFEDEDTDVQRSALFALTQNDDGEGVDELIKVAKTHSNPKIRKEAIYLLGQSDNSRALETLIEIVKK